MKTFEFDALVIVNAETEEDAREILQDILGVTEHKTPFGCLAILDSFTEIDEDGNEIEHKH